MIAGCAGKTVKTAAAQEPDDEPDVSAAAPAPDPPPLEAGALADLPKQDLTETILYEYLLAEIAGQRGNVGLAAQAYVDLAKRTRDPRIARRATEVALYARMGNAAIEAAQIWYEAEPKSQRALQALAGLLVTGGRYDEALPHLKKLVSAGGARWRASSS